MPSKQIKYKLQDVAKDLNVDKTELIELLDKAFPISTARKGRCRRTRWVMFWRGTAKNTRLKT